MPKKFKSGFTLIELLIVITILVIILLLSVPGFLSAQRKINLRNAADTVVQEALGAKNLAVTGLRRAAELTGDNQYVASRYVGLSINKDRGEITLFTKTQQKLDNFLAGSVISLAPEATEIEKIIRLPSDFTIKQIKADNQEFNNLVILYSPLGEMLIDWDGENRMDNPDDVKLVIGYGDQISSVYSRQISIHRVTSLFTIDNYLL
jgi:prepilin-type N-terminal cleavage/methylation domain-containing protein